MTIFIASDHAGTQVKEVIIQTLNAQGEHVEDLGPYSNTPSVSYPSYAIELALKMKNSPSKHQGILICGTGIGMSMVANRYRHLRAALCHSVEDAKMSKQHNDANVLCLGARTTTLEDTLAIVKTWQKTDFQGGRHRERLILFETLGT